MKTNFKKIGKAILFPHISVMVLLIPISVIFLVYSLIYLSSDSVIAVISYVISAYTLTVWCFKAPNVIRYIKSFKNNNRFALKYFSDERLRINISLYGSLSLNALYSLFMLWLGLYHASFWYYSIAGYYISLAAMRFFLVRYTSKRNTEISIVEELKKYRICGIVFLLMNISLSVMIFFMLYFGKTFLHSEIISITMAAYTFGAFTLAIIGIVKYRKYKSPVYTASKAINLAAASVSMLTLSSTLLSTFGSDTVTKSDNTLILALVGGAVSLFIVVMAIYMIYESTKQIKKAKGEASYE